jgi:hypothetical protein
LDVSWPGSIAVKNGSGKVHIWSRSKVSENGDSASVESVSCGSVLPALTMTSFAGGKKVLPEILDSAWQSPQMPKFAGTSMRSGGTRTVESGVALLGLTMTNPSAAWPDAMTDITGVDHDGDTNLGVTAVPRDGDGFAPPPTSFSQDKFADKLYLATRNVMTMTDTAVGCPETYTGTANVTKFDSHVIGCHVKDEGECTSSEAQFVDVNRTVYDVGDATFTTKVVSGTATCADVRAALPATN